MPPLSVDQVEMVGLLDGCRLAMPYEKINKLQRHALNFFLQYPQVHTVDYIWHHFKAIACELPMADAMH